jgi:hypothetical protein
LPGAWVTIPTYGLGRRSRLDRGRTAFFVEDDLAGFDMAHEGKLFGSFQRLHPDRDFPARCVPASLS